MKLTSPLIALTILPASFANQHPTETTLPLKTEGIVNAPIGKLWEAFTTSEGIRRWMAPSAEVDFKVGGKYRSSYTKGSDLTGNDVIENTILAYDPQRMITIRNTRSAKGFPFRKAMDQVWTVIYFTEVDASHTKLEVRMVGFDESTESQNLRKMFKVDNQIVLAAIQKNLAG